MMHFLTTFYIVTLLINSIFLFTYTYRSIAMNNELQ